MLLLCCLGLGFCLLALLVGFDFDCDFALGDFVALAVVCVWF